MFVYYQLAFRIPLTSNFLIQGYIVVAILFFSFIKASAPDQRLKKSFVAVR